MNNRPMWLTLEALAVAAGMCSSFVETHIWSPAYSYFMLMLLVIVDLGAVWFLNQRRYQRRWLLILPAYTLVLAFAHSFGTHEAGLIWLPQAVIGLFVIIHLRRLVTNLGKLELVDEDVAVVLSTRLKRRLDADTEAVATVVLPEPEPTTTPENEPVPA